MVETAPVSARRRGTIKWYNEEKGFGFIVPDRPGTGKKEGGDDFLHRSEVKNSNLTANDLYDGRRVEYELRIPEKGPKKPAAARLKLLD